MAYDKDTPASINEKFSTSWQKINNNFNAIKTLIDQDHETFGSGDDGKHKQITFTQQSSDSTTGSNEVALYAKDNGGTCNLYYRDESSGTVYNMTPNNAGHSNDGYEVLPSGLVLCWGRLTVSTGSASGTGTAAYTFTTSYRVMSSVYFSGNYNALDGMMASVSVSGNTVTATRSDSSHNSAPLSVDYLIIGK